MNPTIQPNYIIQPFAKKNLPHILDVVVPLWSPSDWSMEFRKFNVEYIIRNNLYDNNLHYQLVEQNEETGENQFCAMTFFARKGDVCKAQDWFESESKRFPAELLKSSEMSRAYIEMMDKKTFDLMNEDDIKLTLYVSCKKGCGSKLLNEICHQLKNQGYKNLYLWTDCECNWEWYTEHGYELLEEAVYQPFSSENEDFKTFIFRKPL